MLVNGAEPGCPCCDLSKEFPFVSVLSSAVDVEKGQILDGWDLVSPPGPSWARGWTGHREGRLLRPNR